MSNTVTRSFTVDRDLYNAYKSIVVANGQNVKGNLIRFMQDVIAYETPDAGTIAAVKEVERMKTEPAPTQSYADVDRMMEELLA